MMIIPFKKDKPVSNPTKKETQPDFIDLFMDALQADIPDDLSVDEITDAVMKNLEANDKGEE
jgi:hypothetical protein